ncbi:MAG TPA: hypothetical protein VH858_14945, partial [Hyphomicrobiales bacterium]
MFQTFSVKGFFEAMAPLVHPPLTVAHRFVESAAGLAYYAKRPDGLAWRSKELFDTPIYYLAFHGKPGSLSPLLGRIEAERLRGVRRLRRRRLPEPRLLRVLQRAARREGT